MRCKDATYSLPPFAEAVCLLTLPLPLPHLKVTLCLVFYFEATMNLFGNLHDGIFVPVNAMFGKERHNIDVTLRTEQRVSIYPRI